MKYVRLNLKVIFLLICSTKFLDSVILTLYNFGANQREEYLLLRLFKTALEEEGTRIYAKKIVLWSFVLG